MNAQKEPTVMFRGELCKIVDVSTFEDRSVGISWTVEDFGLVRPNGERVPIEILENLTADEEDAIGMACYNAQADYDWPDYGVPEE